ncbi:MAG: S41 family peptidase [Lachnospiraceae bacterium]|jgi:carboxyl-terminal processing protease|nr:S41 family peptidase [Lachnospiraceae bacterium]
MDKEEKQTEETEDEEEADPGKSVKTFRFGSGEHDLIIGFLIGVLAAGAVAGMIIWSMKTTSKEAVVGSLISEEALTSATSEDIENGKYTGMVEALDDSYAAYYTPEQTESNTQSTSGTYAGIGIGVSKDESTGNLLVSYIYPGSPAEAGGLLSGDFITELNGTAAGGMTLEEVSSMIASNDGKEMTLTVLRGTETLSLKVTPGQVEIELVSHEMKAGSTGYILIPEFVRTTPDQFAEALSDLKSQGMKKLIIDLRNNPGGLVDAAAGCLDKILPAGLEVYTVEKDGSRTDYNSKGEDPLTIPLVLLVNGNTASSAEIFTGACRDRLSCTVVGEKTYGKGIVQTTTTLADGSSIKFTTAHYYTPNGMDINGNGITPDTVVALADGAKPDTSDTDTQFIKAME